MEISFICSTGGCAKQRLIYKQAAARRPAALCIAPCADFFLPLVKRYFKRRYIKAKEKPQIPRRGGVTYGVAARETSHNSREPFHGVCKSGWKKMCSAIKINNLASWTRQHQTARPISVQPDKNLCMCSRAQWTQPTPPFPFSVRCGASLDLRPPSAHRK
jgi:hypothetical protein